MKDTIILHLDWKTFLDVLPDEELGQWTRAIMHYMETGEPPQSMKKSVEVAFYASFERIGRDMEKYEAKCAMRREAGRKGGLRSGEVRLLQQNEANEAKGSKRKQSPSKVKQNEHDPDPEPVPEPVLSSSSDDNRAGAPAGTMMTTTAELLKFSTTAFEGSRVHIEQSLAEAVDTLGPELMAAVLKKCAAAGGRSWAYVEAAVKKCIATGVTSVEQYEAHHRRETGKVVDRATPSGNDILAAARSRPLRLKREE